MSRARLVRRIDALTQALPIPMPARGWDLQQLSDAELEALLPLVTRLEQEGPSVQWQPDEVLLLDHTLSKVTQKQGEETLCRK